jgi:hypothetical protein
MEGADEGLVIADEPAEGEPLCAAANGRTIPANDRVRRDFAKAVRLGSKRGTLASETVQRHK